MASISIGKPIIRPHLASSVVSALRKLLYRTREMCGRCARWWVVPVSDGVWERGRCMARHWIWESYWECLLLPLGVTTIVTLTSLLLLCIIWVFPCCCHCRGVGYPFTKGGHSIFNVRAVHTKMRRVTTKLCVDSLLQVAVSVHIN